METGQHAIGAALEFCRINRKGLGTFEPAGQLGQAVRSDRGGHTGQRVGGTLEGGFVVAR